MRESQIDALARYLVEGLVQAGAITPRADIKDLVACVVELMSENMEIETQIEDEAERIAEAEARRNPGVDADRLRVLIKRRLAEKRNFTL